jgi:hypothetical protein
MINRGFLNMKCTAAFINESIEAIIQIFQTIYLMTYKISNRTPINDKQYLNPLDYSLIYDLEKLKY